MMAGYTLDSVESVM